MPLLSYLSSRFIRVTVLRRHLFISSISLHTCTNMHHAPTLGSRSRLPRERTSQKSRECSGDELKLSAHNRSVMRRKAVMMQPFGIYGHVFPYQVLVDHPPPPMKLHPPTEGRLLFPPSCGLCLAKRSMPAWGGSKAPAEPGQP